jgi:hypothetical protein
MMLMTRPSIVFEPVEVTGVVLIEVASVVLVKVTSVVLVKVASIVLVKVSGVVLEAVFFTGLDGGLRPTEDDASLE